MKNLIAVLGFLFLMSGSLLAQEYRYETGECEEEYTYQRSESSTSTRVPTGSGGASSSNTGGSSKKGKMAWEDGESFSFQGFGGTVGSDYHWFGGNAGLRLRLDRQWFFNADVEVSQFESQGSNASARATQFLLGAGPESSTVDKNGWLRWWAKLYVHRTEASVNFSLAQFRVTDLSSSLQLGIAYWDLYQGNAYMKLSATVQYLFDSRDWEITGTALFAVASVKSFWVYCGGFADFLSQDILVLSSMTEANLYREIGGQADLILTMQLGCNFDLKLNTQEVFFQTSLGVRF